MESNHVSINVPGYQHINDVVNETNKHLKDFREGKISPIKTRSKKEQEKIGGFLPGEQITLAGRTGTGKSAFVLKWLEDFVDPILNPTTYDKTIVLFDSWEMKPWRHMIRLYSGQLEQDVKTILDYHKRMQDDMFQKVIMTGDRYRKMPIFFDNVSHTVADWAEKKKMVRDRFPDYLIINIVDHTRLVTSKNEKSEQELLHGFVTTGMKLKVEFDFINIFLSQMNRNIETGANRENAGQHLPISSDIFGADSVFQASDAVIALHRPGFYGLTQWENYPTGKTADPNSEDNLLLECVLKQRDGWTGTLMRRHNLAINQIYDYE